MSFLIAAEMPNRTNDRLVGALRRFGVDAYVMPADRVTEEAASGDTVLGRIDVLPTLDGVQGCTWLLRGLERRGVTVLNGTGALLAAHDKLVTALRLGRAGVPHPRTFHVDGGPPPAELELPVVVKPRFGSWGRDVFLCETKRSLEQCLRLLRRRPWFHKQGALVQELIPPCGHDLRLVVASAEVVGAIERVPAPSEWRTNVALGATRRRVDGVPEAAREVAIAAAKATGADLVGVDLLPLNGGFVALELNGAVDFTDEYSFGGRDVFHEVATRLAQRAGSPGVSSFATV